MSVEISENIMGLEEAWKRLDDMEAADAAAEVQQSARPGQSSCAKSTTEDGRAAQPENKNTREPNPKSQTQDPKPEATKLDDGKGEQQQQQQPGQKPEDKNLSRYEKARQRQEKSWQEVNAQKEQLKAERLEMDKRTAALEKQQQEFEARRKETEKEFSPEAYDEAAGKFEKAGKFDLAELARAKAAELRKNPPQSAQVRDQAANQQQETARKEWALKAGQDFPELVKQNSSLQVRVAQLFQEEPDLKQHPKGIYLAARLASLEAASAGAVEKDKELVSLRAKVKEYEGLTAPNGEGAATQMPAARSFDQLSDTEQFAELEKLAHETGGLR